MKKQKSLQKFTESEVKVNNLLSLKQITYKDLEQFNEADTKQLHVTINEIFSTLKGTERDNFLSKLSIIMYESTKNELWEYNHIQITRAITVFMNENGRMPSKTEIATKTELSRQTVHKHLNEYTNHPLYLEQIEQFRFMTSKVLAKVFQFAMNGDISAAKLYFNVLGNMNNGQGQNNTLIQNQNNYIQINGTVLSQETLKHLNPDQLNTIETILKTAIQKPEILPKS